MSGRRALITGITGQDGSYLAELLLEKGYEVYGLFRPGAGMGRLPISAAGRIHRLTASLDDREAINAAVRTAQPAELYHLAAQTVVHGDEFETMAANAGGTHNVLASIHAYAPDCRFFLAGSSEMFGDADRSPQDESTPMRPQTVYGISKVTACLLVRHYRRAHGRHASCGILYNHESPRRGEQFVAKKITRAAVRIKAGMETELRLGNLDAIRDWGDAQDFAEAMWAMLQQPTPDDYVIATGQGRTVRELLELAFTVAGLDWKKYVIADPVFYMPETGAPRVGDPAKAGRRLGWFARTPFEQTIASMVVEAEISQTHKRAAQRL